MKLLEALKEEGITVRSQGEFLVALFATVMVALSPESDPAEARALTQELLDSYRSLPDEI